MSARPAFSHAVAHVFLNSPMRCPAMEDVLGAGARRLAEIVFHVWQQECDYFTVVRRDVVRG